MTAVLLTCQASRLQGERGAGRGLSFCHRSPGGRILALLLQILGTLGAATGQLVLPPPDLVRNSLQLTRFRNTRRHDRATSVCHSLSLSVIDRLLSEFRSLWGGCSSAPLCSSYEACFET